MRLDGVEIGRKEGFAGFDRSSTILEAEEPADHTF
jgi:hypothetical protein|tara:strand:+ start:394 stop:498 length:105 start_codon:yes stop_codon:yes gene_type:complete